MGESLGSLGVFRTLVMKVMMGGGWLCVSPCPPLGLGDSGGFWASPMFLEVPGGSGGPSVSCPQQGRGEDGGELPRVLRVPLSPSPRLGGIWESPEGFGGPGRVPGVSQCRVPSRTLVTKVTMAPAGCSGSSSANTWHALPPPGAPACFATNPKILGGPAGAKGEVRVRSVPPLLSGGPVLGVSARTWPWSRRCSSTWGG